MKRPAVKVKVTPLKEDEEKKAAKAAMKAEKAAPKTEQAEKKAAVKAAPGKPAAKAKPEQPIAKAAPEKSVPQKAAKAASKTTEKAAPKEEKQEPKGYSGKWVISQANGGYTFELRASNGETMLTGGHYTTLAGAKGGIETYKNNIRKGNFRIVQTKMGDYIFQLLNASGKLLAYGADYNTRAGCESALESTRRFAATAPVEVSEY